MTDVPKSHPRYLSLKTRDKIVEGVKIGVTSMHGLLAQGRGEAFDYLIGEKTNHFAQKSIKAAVAMLLLAKHPVISVNGNATALCGRELVEMARVLRCKIEVNIFHASIQRERNIINYLKKFDKSKKTIIDFKDIKNKKVIPYIDHNRRYIHPEGTYKADVVFVPLEDGDRCEALKKTGKKVVVVDLNPNSRTAIAADVTVVDNITRCIDLLIKEISLLKNKNKKYLIKIIKNYNNKDVLREARKAIVKNF